MKNVEEVVKKIPVYRVRIKGAPPLRGWALKHLSGMEALDVKPGYWLSEWSLSSDGTTATFNFEPELYVAFDTEAEAKAVSDALRANSEIETEVLKIG
ncbi:MAG: hypothetical protein ACHP8B_10820 [Terriglobales bacterium]